MTRNSHAHTHKHSPNHVWWKSQSQAQAQARYLTIYMPLTLPWIFTVNTWLKCNSCGLHHFSHFLHFWEIGFFQTLTKSLCSPLPDTLTGGSSTFTPLLFWSLGVSCRQLADEHMWDLPGMEITWWRELPEMEFTWWNEALPTDSNAAAAAAAAKLSNLPTP